MYTSTTVPAMHIVGNAAGVFALDKEVHSLAAVNAWDYQKIRQNVFNHPAAPKQENTTMSRRLVQVFIADGNENVPLEKALLYKGEPRFTDLTDQELFFEIDIKTILEEHNKYRATVVDKKFKDRIEHLEPAKIRDLKMTVVLIAQF